MKTTVNATDAVTSLQMPLLESTHSYRRYDTTDIYTDRNEATLGIVRYRYNIKHFQFLVQVVPE